MLTGTGRLRHVDNETDATDASFSAERTLEPGPIQPSDEARKELQGYLAADPSRVGEAAYV
jgi:hypothetical protein